MTAKEIASKIVERAQSNAKHPELLRDEIVKEITKAIEEERSLISKYLHFLHQAIAVQPEYVRHRLLIGSSRIASGNFVEDVANSDHGEWLKRTVPLRTLMYSR